MAEKADWETAIGVKLIKHQGKDCQWEFREPLSSENPDQHTDIVQAPSELSPLQTYLYAGASKNQLPYGDWQPHFAKYYSPEREFFRSVMIRFPRSNLSEGQVQGLFQKAKKERKAKQKLAQAVRICAIESLEVPSR
jgi:hypothetical protein